MNIKEIEDSKTYLVLLTPETWSLNLATGAELKNNWKDSRIAKIRGTMKLAPGYEVIDCGDERDTQIAVKPIDSEESGKKKKETFFEQKLRELREFSKRFF